MTDLPSPEGECGSQKPTQEPLVLEGVGIRKLGPREGGLQQAGELTGNGWNE